jgi:hypothetical protein
MPRIYLLSRPGDANDLTDLLAERLRERYGAQNVIRGSYGRTPAEYAQQATRDIQSSDIVLLVLGLYWITARDQQGVPLLWRPDDPIHIALALALRMRKLIAPTLSDGVNAPDANELPPDVRQLTQFQAFPVRAAPYFVNDMMALVQQINTKLTWRPASIPLAVLSALMLIPTSAFIVYIASLALLGTIGAADLALEVITFLGILLFPIVSVSGITLATRRRHWPWAFALIGMTVLTLCAAVVLAPFETTTIPAIIILGAVPVPLLCTVVFLAFALAGPRREAAFA